MTDYVKSTNFASKDTLAIGNPLKIVKGTEIDTEFNNIATAVATKADLNSPALIGTPTAPTPASGNSTTLVATTAFVSTAVTSERTAAVTLTNKTLTSPAISSPTMTGTPVAPTASLGTNTTQVATTAFVQAALQAVYPVGSIYINSGVTTNPSTLLGFGTWVAFGAGRVMVGFNGSDASFDTLEETGGSNTSGSSSPSMTASNTSLSIPAEGWGTSGGVPGAITSGRLVVGSGASEINEQLESIRAAGGDRSLGEHTHTISGGSHTHSIPTPPYITVAMWKRTA